MTIMKKLDTVKPYWFIGMIEVPVWNDLPGSNALLKSLP